MIVFCDSKSLLNIWDKYLKFRKWPSFTADKAVFMKLSSSGKGNSLMELLYLKTMTVLFSLIAFYSQLFVLKE